MRVDRGGSKGFTGESSRSGKNTEIQKKGGKVKLIAGDQDEVKITQSQNSLKIQINDSDSILLTPEESKNLEIASGEGKISIDPGVTIPMKGRAQKSQDFGTSKPDPSAVSGRKEETQLKADITRKFLSSELRDAFPVQSEQVGRKAKPQEADQRTTPNTQRLDGSDSALLNPEELGNLEMMEGEGKLSVDRNFTVPIKGPFPKSKDQAALKNDTSVVSGHRQESQLKAELTRKFLSSELGEGLITQAATPEPGTLQNPDGKVHEVGADSVLTEPAIQKETIGKDLNASPSTIDPFSKKTNVSLPVNIATPEFGEIDNDMSRLDFEKMSPQQKAVFLQKALDCPPATNSEEVICSVLLSAKTPEEFNGIVNQAGGKSIPATFQNQEMKGLWDRLVGAYDRTDLALNFDDAIKTKGILCGDSALLQKYLPESGQPFLVKTNGMNEPIDLNDLGRTATLCVALENVAREDAGLPFVIPRDLREKVFDLLNNPDLSAEQRTPLLQDLRNEVQLSEYQMREIVSLPINNVFEGAMKNLAALQAPGMLRFQKQIQEASEIFGPESVAAEIAKAEMSQFLDANDPQIGLIREWKTVAAEIFSGPAAPQVNVDRLIHSILNEFVPPTTQFTSILGSLGKGAGVFENGKIRDCVQNLEHLNIPELKNFVSPGVQFLNHLQDLFVLAPQLPAPEFKSFEFLDRLHNGIFQKQLIDVGHAIQQFHALPAVQQNLTELNHWRSEYRSSAPSDRTTVMKEGQKLLDDLTNGILVNRWNALSMSVQELKLDQRMGRLIESIKTGKDLVVSLRNGHFVQVLAALNQRMAGSPAILQIIQQGLHLTTSGTNFFRGLMNREWEKPIAQGLKKSPGSKELREAESIFSDALNLFVRLESVENLSPFIQYQKQFAPLRDEALLRDRIQQYQAKAREIIQLFQP